MEREGERRGCLRKASGIWVCGCSQTSLKKEGTELRKEKEEGEECLRKVRGLQVCYCTLLAWTLRGEGRTRELTSLAGRCRSRW
jgi:hypothetical protein